MNQPNITLSHESGGESENDRLQNISKKVEAMIKKNPSLCHAVEKVRNDPKSMKRLAILPKLAEKANRSLGCELTEFDLIEHSLINKKDEWIEQASSFLDSVSLEWDKKSLSKLFMYGPDTDIDSKYEEPLSGARPIVSALINGGFLAYEESSMPDVIYNFIKDFKNAVAHGKYNKLGIVWNVLLGVLCITAGEKPMIVLGISFLLYTAFDVGRQTKDRKKASTITQKTISNDLLKALGKNTI